MSGLKRPRIETKPTQSHRAREIIELSSDSDPPPCPKRYKSTPPPHVNGFLKSHTRNLQEAQNTNVHAQSAKAGSSASSDNSFTDPRSQQSRELSSSTHADLNRDLITPKKSPFKNVPVWSAAKKQDSKSPELLSRGAPIRLLGGHQSQANSFQLKSKPKTPKDQTPSVSTGPVTQPRPVRIPGPSPANDEADNKNAIDDGIQILSHFTKPLPSYKGTSNVGSPPLGNQPPTSPPRLSQQFTKISLPHRPSPTPPSATKQNHQVFSSSGISRKFTLEVPLSQDRAPLHLRPDYKLKREQLFAKLQQSTKPVVEQLAEVEQYFGQNGFSAAFSTDNSERLVKAASKKVREIDRSKVKLDWGDPDPSALQDEAGFDMSSLIHPIEQVKAVLTTRFKENHDPPITFANDINDRRLNGKFQFVNQYIIQPGVKLSDPKPELACDCNGPCGLETCKCLAKPIDRTTVPVQTYTRYPRSDKVVLSELYIINELDPTSGSFEITECNDFCGCGQECWNRVVEKGRTVPLEIFETAKCGFGVRSSHDIVKGQFIELYLGEVLTEKELLRRENAKEEGAPSYIFSLDFFKAPGQECYHVDGENFGTAMRFVNHSCHPNAASFTMVRNKAEKNVHYIAFFAIRDIEAGEEICIDYQNAGQVEIEGAADEKGALPTQVTEVAREDEDGVVRCQCGSANCRKWLWPPKVRKRKKKKITKHD